jgi:hypothetical protein
LQGCEPAAIRNTAVRSRQVGVLSPAFSQRRRTGVALQNLEKEAFVTQVYYCTLYRQGRRMMANNISQMSADYSFTRRLTYDGGPSLDRSGRLAFWLRASAPGSPAICLAGVVQVMRHCREHLLLHLIPSPSGFFVAGLEGGGPRGEKSQRRRCISVRFLSLRGIRSGGCIYRIASTHARCSKGFMVVANARPRKSCKIG